MNSRPTTEPDPEHSLDHILGGRVCLVQPRRGHRVGHDAVLLAAASGARAGDTVVDLGAGVGGAGLALACRVRGLDLALVERDDALVALAREAIALNAFAGAVRAVGLDVNAPPRAWRAAGLSPGGIDRVIMNPPFNAPRRHQPSPDRARRAAHVADEGAAPWIAAAARLLRRQGELVMIWRADGLGAVLAALASGFGAICVRPVHPRPGKPAIRILVRAVRFARAPLALMPALILEDADGAPSSQAQNVLRHAQGLPFVT